MSVSTYRDNLILTYIQAYFFSADTLGNGFLFLLSMSTKLSTESREYMGKQGYIKLHRQIQECWLYDEKPFCFMSAWIDLLLRASHKDTKIYIDGNLEDVPKGTFVTSILKLSESWGWDRKKTTKFLDTLEKDNMIVRKSSTHRTTITIVNYGLYQDSGATEGQPLPQPLPQTMDNDRATEGQPLPTIKNEKNVKECNKNDKEDKYRGDYFPLDEKLNQAFKDFMKMRKQIKKPMSDRAVTMAINKINNLSNGDNDLAVKLIEQSIMKCWQDIYPLQNNNTNSQGNIFDQLKNC